MARVSYALTVITIALLASAALARPKGGGHGGGGHGGGGHGGGGRGGGGRGGSTGGSFGGSRGSGVSGSRGSYHPMPMPWIIPMPVSYPHWYGSHPVAYGHSGQPDQNSSKPPEGTSDFLKMGKDNGYFLGAPAFQAYPNRVAIINTNTNSKLAHGGDRGFTTLEGTEADPGAVWDLRWTTMTTQIPNTSIKEVPVFQITLNGNSSCVTSKAFSDGPSPTNPNQVSEYHAVGAVPDLESCNKHGFAKPFFQDTTTPVDGNAASNLDKVDLTNEGDSKLFDEFAASLWFATEDIGGPEQSFHLNSYQGALRGYWTCLSKNGGLYACENNNPNFQWSLADLNAMADPGVVAL